METSYARQSSSSNSNEAVSSLEVGGSRRHRQRPSPGLVEVDKSAEIVCLHNRLRNLLADELRSIDRDRRRSTEAIVDAQRQVVRRFADRAVRSAVEQARLVGDHEAELRLVRRLRLQRSTESDVRRLATAGLATDSAEFRRIIAGKVSLQRLVDCLLEGMGLTAATTAATAAAAAVEKDNGDDQRSVEERVAVTAKRRDSCVWGPGRFDAYSTEVESEWCKPAQGWRDDAIAEKVEPAGHHEQTNRRALWRCNSSQRPK